MAIIQPTLNLFQEIRLFLRFLKPNRGFFALQTQIFYIFLIMESGFTNKICTFAFRMRTDALIYIIEQ